MSSASFAKRRGLTLLELLVVVTLVSLVTATVVVRLGTWMSQAVLGQALSQWTFSDAQLRHRAARGGRPVSLHLEIGTGRLACEWEVDSGAAPTVRDLGRGATLTRFISATRDVTYGPLVITYSDRGTSESFAIELAGGRKRKWIFVAGITGQVSEVADEGEIKNLLERLVPSRADAG